MGGGCFYSHSSLGLEPTDLVCVIQVESKFKWPKCLSGVKGQVGENSKRKK